MVQWQEGGDCSIYDDFLSQQSCEVFAVYEQAAGLSHVPEIDEQVKNFRCGGGGARSAAWLRIKANIFGWPIETLDVEDTACLGAALIAGCGIGVFDSPQTAVSRLIRPRQRFEPDPKKHWQYRKKLELYGRLANQFADQFNCYRQGIT